MQTPEAIRPHFPVGYIEGAKSFVPWSHVEQRLTDAVNYWLCTVRPDGRPHAIPKWAVWVNEKIYFDGSPETRHARNIAAHPAVTVHLESGSDVVIVDGAARAIDRPPPALAEAIAQAYRAKYTALGYAPAADSWDNGGLFEITPHTVIAWTQFTENPTKFVLKQP
jgi:hypothetical protein